MTWRGACCDARVLSVISHEGEEFGYERKRWVDTAALPVSVLIALMANILVIPALLMNSIRIWLHEFGHAFIAWWSSRAATPLGLGWTSYNLEPSWFVTLCFLFLMGLGAYKAWIHQYFYWATICMASIVMLFLFTFVWSHHTFQWAFYFGGVAGEIYLSSILIIGFYCDGPRKIRWDFLRFPVLLAATYVFVESLKLWSGVLSMTHEIPFGTLWGGQGDAGGDMNQLRDVFDWSERHIAGVYWRWIVLCGVAIFVVWIIAFIQAWSRRKGRRIPDPTILFDIVSKTRLQ